MARAAEGSVRDGLSILDQAIAHGHGAVSATQVREMLGLSDRSAIRDLFGLVLAGDAPGMLAALKSQYALGTEPAALRSEEHTSELQSLMRISYAVFCLKK